MLLLVATILKPSTTFDDFNFPVAASLALRISFLPCEDSADVSFSVAFVVASVAFVVASVAFVAAYVAFVVVSVAFSVALVVVSVSFSVALVVVSCLVSSSEDELLPDTLIIWLATLNLAPIEA